MHAGRFMNLVRASLLGLATLTGAGCFTARPSGPDWFYHHAARNLTEKPIANHDERKFTKFVEGRAAEAWEQLCRSSGRKHSDPYGDGFREGFVDYVEAGGTGEPPYLPPFRYRLTKYRTADGIRAVEEWYAGFRHGAAVARESGLRELNYVPLPGPAIPADARVHAPGPVLPQTILMPPPPAAPGGAPEFLHAPRPANPGPLPQMPPPTPPGSAPGAGKPSAKPAFIPANLPAPALPAPQPLSQAPAKPQPSKAIAAVAAWSGVPPPAPERSPAPLRPPVVVLDRAGPSVPVPVPPVAPASARSVGPGDFGPWQPAQPSRPPTVVRDP